MRSIYQIVGAITIAIALCSARRVLAQPDLTSRQALADALNSALAASHTTIPITTARLYDAVDDACHDAAPLNLEIQYYSDHFVLRRKLRTGAPINPTELHHPLVDDLNNWLNTVWFMDLTGIPEFNDLDWTCSNPGQNYFTREITEGDANYDNVLSALQQATGEDRMLAKYYNIDGVMKSGHDLLAFSDVSPRVIRYITRVDTAERHLGKFYLKVRCDNADNNAFVEIRFSMITDKYSDDCGIERGDEPVIRFSISLPESYCGIVSGGGIANDVNTAAFVKLKSLSNHFGTPAGTWTPDTSGIYPIVDKIGCFGISNDGYLYFHTFHTEESEHDSIALCQITAVESNDEYCEVAYCNGGTFGLDDYKRLVYTPPVGGCTANCSPQPVPCLEFCDLAQIQMPVVSSVIKADARRFADTVSVLPESIFPLSAGGYENPNVFETGRRGKWRSIEEYAYRTGIKPGSGQFPGNAGTASERVYNDAGIFDLQLFGWRNAANDPAKWLRTTAVDLYSQNGSSSQEKDILDIPSAAKFGYHQQLPILAAKNATYNSVWFESFEGDIVDYTATHGQVIEGVGHSGIHSYKPVTNEWSDPIEEHFTTDVKAQTDGLLIRAWVKIAYPESPTLPTANDKQCPFKMQFVGTSTYTLGASQFNFVAKTGEWSLYEGVLENLPPDDYQIKLNGIFAEGAWVDDIRIQPQKSEMNCFVYDPATLRQSVVFDDQHFGTYFQYNGEGKLVRKIAETVRGMKTVEEKQYHTPLLARQYASGNVLLAETQLQGGDGPSMSIPTDPSTPDSSTSKGMKADLFNMELGLKKRDVKVLGVDIDHLGEKRDEMKKLLKSITLDSLKISELEKLKLIDELENADAALGQLAESGHSQEVDSLQQASKRQVIQAAARRRAELMQQLGLSEQSAKELIEQVRALKRELQQDELDKKK